MLRYCLIPFSTFILIKESSKTNVYVAKTTCRGVLTFTTEKHTNVFLSYNNLIENRANKYSIYIYPIFKKQRGCLLEKLLVQLFCWRAFPVMPGRNFLNLFIALSDIYNDGGSFSGR